MGDDSCELGVVADKMEEIWSPKTSSSYLASSDLSILAVTTSKWCSWWPEQGWWHGEGLPGGGAVPRARTDEWTQARPIEKEKNKLI
jgi:hypothetical protein